MSEGAAMYPAVPPRYRGLWQRVLLRDTQGRVDTTTKVYWLQTASLYCDIRVPLERADCAAFSGLAELDAVHRSALAAQAGFAGHLQVEEALVVDALAGEEGVSPAAVRDRCSWHRHMDYQPDNGQVDAGWMQFANGRLMERGVYADYHEEWVQVAQAGDTELALELVEEFDDQGPARPRQGYLLVCGDYFMLALARTSALPAAPSLQALFASHGDAGLQREWLDCTIDFGRCNGQRPWEIRLSTLPFRERRSLFGAGHGLRKGEDGDWLEVEDGQPLRRWRARECPPELEAIGFD